MAKDTQYLQRFRGFRGDCEYIKNEKDVKDLVRNIMHSYRRGMGSFTDFALYTNGEYIPGPDLEFDRLRTQLFDMCVDIITIPRES